MNALTKRNKQSKDATKKLIKNLIKENIEQEFRPALDKAVKETAATVRKTTVAEVLYNMRERGRTKDEILEFYEDMVNLDYRKNLYNKTINNYDVLAFISEQYGIDFDRLDTDFAVKER
jgi:anthranilate phosphoribosyltransferase